MLVLDAVWAGVWQHRGEGTPLLRLALGFGRALGGLGRGLAGRHSVGLVAGAGGTEMTVCFLQLSCAGLCWSK